MCGRYPGNPVRLITAVCNSNWLMVPMRSVRPVKEILIGSVFCKAVAVLVAVGATIQVVGIRRGAVQGVVNGGTVVFAAQRQFERPVIKTGRMRERHFRQGEIGRATC